MTGELRSASSDEDILAIQPSTVEVARKHLIVGGRSGSGLATAVALAKRGEGVIITHSGAKKGSKVDEALDSVREAFASRPEGLPGDPQTDVISVGGDLATAEHRDQVIRATQAWLGKEALLTSVGLFSARGTKSDEEYAMLLNRDAHVALVEGLLETEIADGRSVLTNGTVIYPTSTLAHQWNQPNAEHPDFYAAVGPTKRAAFDALMGEPRERLEKVGGRLITVVMGIIEGTLVATTIQRNLSEHLEDEDVKATTITDARAGEGIADIVTDRNYQNGDVLALLRDRIEHLSE